MKSWRLASLENKQNNFGGDKNLGFHVGDTGIPAHNSVSHINHVLALNDTMYHDKLYIIGFLSSPFYTRSSFYFTQKKSTFKLLDLLG